MPETGGSIHHWRHLKDEQLYTDNDYALASLENGFDLDASGFTPQKTREEKTIYHCYWYGVIGRKQAFSIKSFLCTQDLGKCRVVLWLDQDNGFENHDQNPLLKAILPFIEVRSYDPFLEMKDTPWKNKKNLVAESQNLAKRSDAFRFLVLFKYGGVYFDLDVMFLKDFGTLRDSEFCYAWESQPFANSALLRLNRQSLISTYIMHKSIEKHTVLPWVILNYSDVLLKDLYVFPCALFDPIWQGGKLENSPLADFPDFFKPFDREFINKSDIDSYQKFFPGCYAYHWHNQWKADEVENSFFGIFENEFNEQLMIPSAASELLVF
ncbi:Glycosyltransferase sugar-binding region containing DXD motif-containing protein [Pedobacter steynii]|uniref:Glycosyltransferase sugar-binding region containing DXD motif-containing protein n=2 Tax=Pedobacter steynii TaxID=430522 RepID=A0A1G9SKQ9_9SPHI|nr:Glycosyltransferase sugar-binding region containing DXD motif-containing protein [Pedobacter steynii]